MKKHRTCGLRCNSDGNTGQIGRESRPDIGLDLRHSSIKIRSNDERLLGRHDQVTPFHLPLHTKSMKNLPHHFKMLHTCVVNPNVSVRYNSRANITNNFQQIGSNRKLAAIQTGYTGNMQCIRADAFYFCAQNI